MNTLLAMNPSHVEPDPADTPARDMRYAYASGSRPLDGYTIKRGVGRGGFGEVYFAVSDAGKEVALKLIRRNLEVELRGVTQCLNLKHPNLIDLYDVRTDANDDRWVVMEYVSGASLDDVIARHPEGMPTDLALHWFRGICAAVAYLHDHGIVHRDLKPANIFLDHGQVKIGDYGLSKFISCSRRSGQTESVGTVHYMAPEIANGRYGKEIDTYALGIILFEMLTGQVPFEGESVGEVLMKHLTAEPDVSELDEPYRSMVQRAMAKDPARRVQDVGELLAMLEGRSTAVPSTPSPEPPYRSPGAPDSFDDEPIAAAVRLLWHNACESLVVAEWPPLARAFGGFGLALFLIITSGVWLPFALVTGVAYIGYRLVRAAVLQLNGTGRPRGNGFAAGSASGQTRSWASGSPPSASRANTSPGYRTAAALESPAGIERPWRRRKQAQWHHVVQEHLASRSLHERVSEVVGSLLLTAVVAVVGSVLVNLLTMPTFQPALVAWMALTSTLAGWAVLVPAKIAEGRLEDQAPMRFTMLLLGAAVGCAAWAIAQFLLLPLPIVNDLTIDPHDALFSQLFDDSGRNSLYEQRRAENIFLPLPMYAAYFAFLLALLRWWRLADPTRSARVSLWSVAWCAGIAYLLSFFWWFPQPVGLAVAGIVAFSVQLASAWLPPSRRQELAEQYVV